MSHLRFSNLLKNPRLAACVTWGGASISASGLGSEGSESCGGGAAGGSEVGVKFRVRYPTCCKMVWPSESIIGTHTLSTGRALCTVSRSILIGMEPVHSRGFEVPMPTTKISCSDIGVLIEPGPYN
jgi:hypothetical protein